MTYLDLVANIEIVINSIQTNKDNYQKNLIIAQERIDTMMNKSILECNRPSIKVYGEPANNKGIKLKCVPANRVSPRQTW